MQKMHQTNNHCCGCPSEWVTDTNNQRPWAEQYDYENDGYDDCVEYGYGYEYCSNNPRPQKRKISRCRNQGNNNCRQRRNNCWCGFLNCFRCW